MIIEMITVVWPVYNGHPRPVLKRLNEGGRSIKDHRNYPLGVAVETEL